MAGLTDLMKFFTTSKLSENIRKTPEGYLVCIGVPIARTGEMVYAKGETPLEAGPDGKVIITRDADEVFRPETMASFEGKSITVAHPEDFVSPENWSELTHGIVQNVRRGKGDEENDLISDFLVMAAEAIELVEGGLREVSCGYEAEYIQTGIGRGIQKNIIGNHVALVEEGRAGTSYAINDHKGKGSVMKLGDKIKAIFGKAQDDALKLIETKDDLSDVTPSPAAVTGMDELCKAVKDLVGLMGPKQPAKDDTTPAVAGVPAETVAKDDDVAPGLEDRLTKLEAAVAKITEMMSKAAPAGDDDEDGDSEIVGDDDGDEDDGDADTEDADGDDDDSDSDMTGDSASRVEILAPGMKLKGKDFRVKALKTAYATTDGKAVIEQFTAGKSPNFKDEKFVEVLFTAASEVLKKQRATELSRTRTHDFQSNLGQPKGAMTAERINEMNAKHYASRTTH